MRKAGVMSLEGEVGSSLVAQAVKGQALSRLRCGFDPWPRNFHMPQVGIKERGRGGERERGRWDGSRSTRKETGTRLCRFGEVY